ncbi:hypothetical protein B0J14DRAFT_693227 [Halenospora varia]|nr:hypothetical protein B0J14DRAFT_693227 [Halenospora varia]
MASRTREKRYYYNLQLRSDNTKFANLAIRGPREADAEQILKLWSNPNHKIRVPDLPPNPSQSFPSRNLTSADFDGMGPPGSLPLFAFLDDTLIGGTSFCNPYTDVIEECVSSDDSTLSYVWSPGLQLKIDGPDDGKLRRGYRSECVGVLTDWAFGGFGKKGIPV